MSDTTDPVDPSDPRIERYTSESDSWFLAYCNCKDCSCINQQTKIRERLPNGRAIYWCTYCYLNHRGKP